MDVILDGEQIESTRDVHRLLSEALDFGPYYGWNKAALWDRLSADVSRPMRVRWLHSEASRDRLGADFDGIVEVFERTAQQDADAGLIDRFTFLLE